MLFNGMAWDDAIVWNLVCNQYFIVCGAEMWTLTVLVLMNDCYLFNIFIVVISRPRGAVVRAEEKRSDDPCVPGSNPTVGCRCRSFGWDRINWGPVSQ
jgi:hypothetical protein